MNPDGSVRITVDYKALNKVIITDPYPLPSVIELYAKLVKARVFSKIDLNLTIKSRSISILLNIRRVCV
jgi:hypothetical protein